MSGEYPVRGALDSRYSRVLREHLQVVVLVDGVVVAQVQQLLQGLVDEDDADERGEGLLGEARDVAHQGAGVRGNQHHAQEGRPQPDARPQRQVGQAVLPVGQTAYCRVT